MDIDFKGMFKDNQKLILSALGIVVMAILIVTQNSVSDPSTITDGLDGGSSSNSTNTNNATATPVSNGKEDFYDAAPSYQLEAGVDYTADIVTSMGTITVDLYELDTPITVNNFVFLAEDGFYDKTSFHRVMSDFVIQGGDPRGDGYGGPGYEFADEIVDNLEFEPYVLAMANSGADTNGSQFFITTKNSNTSHLNGVHTIFGEVIDGFDVVDKIEAVDVDGGSMPIEPVYINTIRILTSME